MFQLNEEFAWLFASICYAKVRSCSLLRISVKRRVRFAFRLEFARRKPVFARFRVFQLNEEFAWHFASICYVKVRSCSLLRISVKRRVRFAFRLEFDTRKPVFACFCVSQLSEELASLFAWNLLRGNRFSLVFAYFS